MEHSVIIFNVIVTFLDSEKRGLILNFTSKVTNKSIWVLIAKILFFIQLHHSLFYRLIQCECVIIIRLYFSKKFKFFLKNAKFKKN